MKKKLNFKGIFLDSGAFSAHMKNEPIDLDKYIDFIKQYEEGITHYANLDVIGDAKGTWKNQRKMEKAGLTPLPVFHIGEDFKYMDRCMEYDYFCIGGMARIGQPDRVAFLDKCFSIICDTPKKLPNSKVHAFGMTNLKLLTRYPWYSADSTTWLLSASMGEVYIPIFREGQPIYTKYTPLNISTRMKYTTEMHYCSIPAKFKAKVDKYVSSLGFPIGKSKFRERDLDYELKDNEKVVKKNEDSKEVETLLELGLTNDRDMRLAINMIFFIQFEKAIPQWPFAFNNFKTELF